jgi:hypothetical protein
MSEENNVEELYLHRGSNQKVAQDKYTEIQDQSGLQCKQVSKVDDIRSPIAQATTDAPA